MDTIPIENPDDVQQAIHTLQTEMATFRLHLDQIMGKKNPYPEAGSYIVRNKESIDSWRSQLFNLALYVKRYIAPEQRSRQP